MRISAENLMDYFFKHSHVDIIVLKKFNLAFYLTQPEILSSAQPES